MGLKAALNSMMRPPERKLFATGMTALAISAGFVLVVYKIDAKGSAREVIDAYKTACEWLVYLFAAFAGGNALTWWSQRSQGGEQQNVAKSVPPSSTPPTAPPAPPTK